MDLLRPPWSWWPWPLAALFVFKLLLDYLGIKWLGPPWFDDAPKQPDAPAPSLGSDGPPLPADAIHLPMPGWTVTESSDRCVIWRDADEAALTLTATSVLEIPLADENALRAFCRRISEGAKGGLVEAGSISTPTGSAARFIYKRKESREAPFAFTGMLMKPVDGGMHVWAISVRGGAAGTRESMVALEMMRDGTLSEETYKKSWNADPYDPKYRGVPPDSLRCMADDERYDAEYPDHPLSQVRRVLRELADPEDTRRAYADLSTLECGSLELAGGIRILTLRVAERGKKLRAGAVSDALNRSHLALLAPADPEAPHGVLLDLRDTGYVFAGEDLTHVMMTMTLLGLSRGAPLPCAILGDAETLEALRTRLAKAHEGGNFILKRFCLTGSEDEAFAHLRQSIAQA